MPPRLDTIQKARQLRRALSPPEVILWQWMRARPAGLKFRRQHPAEPYVLDLYCAALRVAIEVDGNVHDHAVQIDHDERRDARLAVQGIRVVRIRAVDVLRDMDTVTRHILHLCTAPLHQPTAGPPPLAWGGLSG